MFIWLCTRLDRRLIFNDVLLKLPLLRAVWPNHLCRSSKCWLLGNLPHPFLTTPFTFLLQSLFGSPWADEFALWLQELKSDSEGRGPMNWDIGATWFELGLSFFRGYHCFGTWAIARESSLDCGFLVVRMLLRFLLLFRAVSLPINVTSVRLGSHQAIISLSSISEAKKSLKLGQAAARRLRRAVGVFWHPFHRQKCSLFAMLGLGSGHSGRRETGKSMLVKYC